MVETGGKWSGVVLVWCVESCVVVSADMSRVLIHSCIWRFEDSFLAAAFIW